MSSPNNSDPTSSRLVIESLQELTHYRDEVTDSTEIFSFQAMARHNILEPTTGVTFFNSGSKSDPSKSDPTELFPSIVQVIAG
jgi:hypothetical protein